MILSKSAHYQVLKESLEKEGIEYLLETNVKPNPRAEDCDAMAKVAIEEKVDAIIALGGGSAMDQAKAVAAIVTNGKTTVEWGDVELEHSIYHLFVFLQLLEQEVKLHGVQSLQIQQECIK